MPIYQIIDTTDGSEHEVLMPYSDLSQYLVDHPEYTQKICAPALLSGISGGHRIDSGFNDVLQKVAEQNPHSPLADQYGSKGIRETKTREVVKKHKART